MKRTLSLILILLALCSCQFSKKNNSFSKTIQSKWIYVKGEDAFYQRLEFYNQYVIVYTFGDTILSYKYKIRRNNLILSDVNKTKVSNRIYKLSSDSLIFMRLLENRTEQVFTNEK